MKQSDLTFIENSKKCVWCKFNNIEFYWEIKSCTICISDDSYMNLFVPEEASSKLVRAEITAWIKSTFGV